jgi:hypothetical protein
MPGSFCRSRTTVHRPFDLSQWDSLISVLVQTFSSSSFAYVSKNSASLSLGVKTSHSQQILNIWEGDGLVNEEVILS